MAQLRATGAQTPASSKRTGRSCAASFVPGTASAASRGQVAPGLRPCRPRSTAFQLAAYQGGGRTGPGDWQARGGGFRRGNSSNFPRYDDRSGGGGRGGFNDGGFRRYDEGTSRRFNDGGLAGFQDDFNAPSRFRDYPPQRGGGYGGARGRGPSRFRDEFDYGSRTRLGSGSYDEWDEYEEDEEEEDVYSRGVPEQPIVAGKLVMVNEMIRAPKVRLLGTDKAPLGVVPLDEALMQADEEDVDLVCISPDADPPVCRLVTFDKYKYEIERAIKAKQKNSGGQDMKELRLKPTTDTNDFQVKLKQATKFLEKGSKVKIVMKFEGRHLRFKDQGKEMMLQIVQDLDPIAKLEGPMQIKTSTFMAMLMPKEK